MGLSSPSARRLPRIYHVLAPLILTFGHDCGVAAMHADEAGVNDFLLKSAGHGDVGVAYARLVSTGRGPPDAVESVWVTSQSAAHPSAVVDDIAMDGGGDGAGDDDAYGGPSSGGSDDRCAIAARNITTGDVIWVS